jgi:transposase
MTEQMHKVAQRVINKCGGVRNVSRMLCISTKAVYKWCTATRYGGTGGLIPVRRQLELMIAAKAHGIELKPEDFFPKGST